MAGVPWVVWTNIETGKTQHIRGGFIDSSGMCSSSSLTLTSLSMQDSSNSIRKNRLKEINYFCTAHQSSLCLVTFIVCFLF